ncbi:hypothetical protein UFOVP1246_42 [uncultured Caudovirales phage]|uniref:Uncharacterized protein n=1 Tax=uncultured Caudovirales phage TaxID=2100421 RepID=A0A6J5RFU9_9CAUD|nr:hypothetical protein UFOVP1246_42 [uncultured Caudovirales phage]
MKSIPALLGTALLISCIGCSTPTKQISPGIEVATTTTVEVGEPPIPTYLETLPAGM